MIRVRVPATSANLGPGFDSLGIALSIYNEDNIIFMAMKKVFNKYNFKFKGLKIKIIKQDIPISRGLGSSSSCIVAGLIGAFALMNKELEKEEVFKLAIDIEGHPDNVCPAIFGGLVSTVMANGETLYNKIEIKNGVKFIALIPNFKLSTEKARAILPSEVSFKDSVYNIGRAALLISCFMNGNYKLLREATKDRLHQQYRSKLIEGFDEVYEKALNIGAYGCFLSGAGPTIMAIIDENDLDFVDDIKKFIKEEKLNWNIKELAIDKIGAKILKGD